MIHERLSTCPLCTRDAATSEKQWQLRQKSIRNHPQIDFAICPGCKTTNWALTRMHIVEKPDRRQTPLLSVEAWIAIILAAAVVTVAIAILTYVRGSP